jgi:hypothetical protein
LVVNSAFFCFVILLSLSLSFRRQQQLPPYKLKCDKEQLNSKYVHFEPKESFSIYVNFDISQLF